MMVPAFLFPRQGGILMSYDSDVCPLTEDRHEYRKGHRSAERA